jgi:hypothetical protein
VRQRTWDLVSGRCRSDPSRETSYEAAMNEWKAQQESSR